MMGPPGVLAALSDRFGIATEPRFGETSMPYASILEIERHIPGR
jgi:hypothetical protein